MYILYYPSYHALLTTQSFLNTRPKHLSKTLFRRVGNELNTLGDVTAQTLVASLEELLLVVVCGSNDVVCLLGTGWAEFDGDGEEVATGELLNFGTAVDTGEVDEGGLDDAGLALGGADDFLGESENDYQSGSPGCNFCPFTYRYPA